MEDEILLASIPHTGTKFLENALRESGYSVQAASEFAKYEKTLYFTHIDRPDSCRLAYYMMLRGIPTVMPFRHPYVTAHSWLCRGLPLAQLITQYNRFFKYFQDHVAVLPIDGDGATKGYAMSKINIWLGIDLQCDFSKVVNPIHPVNHNAGLRYYDVQDPDPNIVELVNEHMPELFRLGYYEGNYV